MKLRISAAFICIAVLAACGGGGGGGATSTPPTSPPSTAPAVSPSPSPAPPQASTTAISFSSNALQSLTVTETGYTKGFTESDTCNPLTGQIAAVSPVVLASPPPGTATYNVSPINAGTCAITVTDAGGQSVTVPVNVSTAAITVQ